MRFIKNKKEKVEVSKQTSKIKDYSMSNKDMRKNNMNFGYQSVPRSFNISRE